MTGQICLKSVYGEKMPESLKRLGIILPVSNNREKGARFVP